MSIGLNCRRKKAWNRGNKKSLAAVSKKIKFREALGFEEINFKIYLYWL